MSNPPDPNDPSLELEDLGDLTGYEDDDLLWLRERLIMSVEDIQKEMAEASQRKKELSHQQHLLQEKAARRARALRAVKHTLSQRGRTAHGGEEAEPRDRTHASPAGVAKRPQGSW